MPRRFPWVTFALIVINCIVFLFIEPSGLQTGPQSGSASEQARVNDTEQWLMTWALVPCEVVQGKALADHPKDCEKSPTKHIPEHKSVLLPLLTATFLHGSIEHLVGNLLFLWVFGKNVEDRVGKILYLLLYGLGGVAAWATSILSNTASAVPHLGASGAIAAVMGAYLVFFPRERVLTQIAIPFQVVYIPAAVVLLMFFITQFFTGADSGVAWQAHAGGMVAGAVLALLMLPLPWVRRQSPRRARQAAAHTQPQPV